MSLTDVRCKRLQFSLSTDGARAAVHDPATIAGVFVSTAPFARDPHYQWTPGAHSSLHWSGDGRVIVEWAGGYRVVDPNTRSTRQINIEAAKPDLLNHDPDIVPRFIDNEVFSVRDRIAHDLLATNIDTGATRVAIAGYGARSPDFLFVGAGGREVLRVVSKERAQRDFVLAARGSDSGGIIALEAQEELIPLGSAEMLALSNNGRFLALNKRVTGERVVVVVDPRVLERRDVLKLATDGPFALGATTDGGALEWSTQFAPLPTIAFASVAPAALRAFADRFPNAWLEYQSQSKDGTIRIFKVTELSGRVHFVRLSGNRADAFNVPCRQPPPEVIATSRTVAATASSDAGWIVQRYSAGTKKKAPLVFVLPNETARTIDPMLDPLLDGLVSDGVDVRMLVYPGSWTRGRLRSGANTSVTNIVAFARRAISSELSRAMAGDRPVILLGRGFGAMLAFHLGSTAPAGSYDGIFAEGAMVRAEDLPIAVRRDADPFGDHNTARGVPVMFFHGADDGRTWVDLDIEEFMSRRGGGALMNRCNVIDGMNKRAETAFQLEEERKAFDTFVGMVASARTRRAVPSSPTPVKCTLVPRPRG